MSKKTKFRLVAFCMFLSTMCWVWFLAWFGINVIRPWVLELGPILSPNFFSGFSAFLGWFLTVVVWGGALLGVVFGSLFFILFCSPRVDVLERGSEDE